MEQQIRLILLVVGAIIVLWILRDGIRRKKNNKLSADKTQHDDKLNNNVKKSVLKKKKQQDKKPQEKNIEQEVKQEERPEEQTLLPEEPIPDVIAILIKALPERHFDGNFLLQTLFSNDLHYGDMQIFHQYSKLPNQVNKILFSLASANEPGDFHLGTMKSYTCDALIIFMEPHKHTSPDVVFEKMLETAKQLAKDLKGELRTSSNKPLTEDEIQKMRL